MLFTYAVGCFIVGHGEEDQGSSTNHPIWIQESSGCPLSVEKSLLSGGHPLTEAGRQDPIVDSQQMISQSGGRPLKAGRQDPIVDSQQMISQSGGRPLKAGRPEPITVSQQAISWSGGYPLQRNYPLPSSGQDHCLPQSFARHIQASPVMPIDTKIHRPLISSVPDHVPRTPPFTMHLQTPPRPAQNQTPPPVPMAAVQPVAMSPSHGSGKFVLCETSASFSLQVDLAICDIEWWCADQLS